MYSGPVHPVHTFSWYALGVLCIAVSGHDLDSGWQLVSLDGPPIFTAGASGSEGGLVATLVTVLAIVGIMLLDRRWRRDAKDQAQTRG